MRTNLIIHRLGNTYIDSYTNDRYEFDYSFEEYLPDNDVEIEVYNVRDSTGYKVGVTPYFYEVLHQAAYDDYLSSL